MHKEEGLSFKNVIAFNLDEYYPISPTATQRYIVVSGRTHSFEFFPLHAQELL